jgi:hypothetical protein
MPSLSKHVSPPLCERTTHQFIRSIRSDLETTDLKGRVATPAVECEMSPSHVEAQGNTTKFAGEKLLMSGHYMITASTNGARQINSFCGSGVKVGQGIVTHW